MDDSAQHTVESLRPGEHLCSIYETEEEQRALASAFVRRGLESNEKVVCIGPHSCAHEVRRQLEDAGIEVDAHLSAGHLRLLGADEVYLPRGIFEPDRMVEFLRTETEAALQEGYEALRVTGEMTWAIPERPGTERLVEYENELNSFLSESKCLALCLYDKRAFDPRVIFDVLRTHPRAVLGTEVYDNFYYLPPTALSGPDTAAAELENWLGNLRERSKQERNLQESETRYRNLYNSIRDAILVADTERTIIHCNQAFSELFGYPLEEVEGKKTAVVYADEAEYRDLGARLSAADRNQTVLTVHYKTKDGRVFPGETTVFALHDAAGAVRGYIGLIRDVTQRLETERALEQERRFAEAVLETSGALVVVLDPQRHIVRTNEACRRITGYTDEELQRLPLEDLVPEEEHAGVDGVFDELFAGAYPTTHENHWITKTGEKRFIAWTSTVVSDQTGEVERIIATGIDITERIREEQNRIRRLEAEIDRLEEYSSPGNTRTTRQIYAQHSLKQADPSRFDALRNEYGTVLLDRLEERMYKTDNRISARLEELARTLGRLEAGPKDVVEMHVEALRELTAGEHPKRAQALSDEGRLLALELMGYLVSVYRNQVPYGGGA